MDEEKPRSRLGIWGASLALLFLATFFFLPCIPWPSAASLGAAPSGNCGSSPRRQLLTPIEWMDLRPWRGS